MTTPTCRNWPRAYQCDRQGPGGFMGHTCNRTAAPIDERVRALAMHTVAGRSSEPIDERVRALAMHTVRSLPR